MDAIAYIRVHSLIFEVVFDDEAVGILRFLPSDFDGLVRVVVLADGYVAGDVVELVCNSNNTNVNQSIHHARARAPSAVCRRHCRPIFTDLFAPDGRDGRVAAQLHRPVAELVRRLVVAGQHFDRVLGVVEHGSHRHLQHGAAVCRIHLQHTFQT